MMNHDERLAFVRLRISEDVDWQDDSFSDALPEAIVAQWEREIGGGVDEGNYLMVADHEQGGMLAAAVRLLDAERDYNIKKIDAALKPLNRDQLWHLGELFERAMSTCKFRDETSE